MNLWFAGSREGMTLQQKDIVKEFVFEHRHILNTIRHGDEIGSEQEFHNICYNLNLIDKMVIHPLNNRKHRALCKAPNILPPTSYEIRRQAMADNSSFLLAIVNNYKENLRSSCWSLVKLAKDKKMPVLIVYPNGIMFWSSPAATVGE